MTRWYEDLVIDEAFPLGEHTFTEEEIIRFGRQYDPQYFHTDPEAAKLSHFGGLVASGWHTAGVGQRKMVDALMAESERLRALGQEPGLAGPSPGINEMVFEAPVRPGDTVSYTLTVRQMRPSNSLPGWGVLVSDVEARNQNDLMVYRAEVVSFTKMRDFKPSLGLKLAMWAADWPVVGRLVRR